jgi:hypothetical protein
LARSSALAPFTQLARSSALAHYAAAGIDVLLSGPSAHPPDGCLWRQARSSAILCRGWVCQ